MGARQKRWARTARIELMMLLGYICADCGSEDELVFDCIEPQGDRHHKMDTSARMSFYRRQHEAGNLQILCSKCNSKKSKKETETIPF